jgi:hypothetical protein
MKKAYTLSILAITLVLTGVWGIYRISPTPAKYSGTRESNHNALQKQRNDSLIVRINTLMAWIEAQNEIIRHKDDVIHQLKLRHSHTPKTHVENDSIPE